MASAPTGRPPTVSGDAGRAALSDAELARYVSLLRAGGVLACPTETQMGLLADALQPAAVARVVAMKRRPAGEPIALLLPDAAALSTVSEGLSERATELASAHWPGPLTLVVPALASVPGALVRDGTIGVRVPGPSPALEVAQAFGGPLTATSANLSGQPTAKDGAQARSLFGAQLAAVVPGSCPGGAPSTIVRVHGDSLEVLRRGAIDLSSD